MTFKKNMLNGLVIGLVVSLVVFVFYEYILSDFLKRVELSFYDMKMKRTVGFNTNDDGSRKEIKDVIIINIDARSIYQLGKFYTWPRTYWARLIDFLGEGGAKAVGIDVLFDPDTRHPSEERDFLNSIKNAHNVYNSVLIEPADEEQFLHSMKSLPEGFPEELVYKDSELEGFFPIHDRLEPGFPELAIVSKGLGHVVFFPDIDGVIRSNSPFMQFNEFLFPSLSLKIAADSLNIEHFKVKDNRLLFLDSAKTIIRTLELSEDNHLPIYFNGTFQTFKYISFYDVMSERVPKEYFKNKIVLIGTSLPGLYDLKSTPLQKAFPGVELHANIIYNILNNIQIHKMSNVNSFFLLLGIGVFFSILIVFIRPVKAVFILLFILLIYLITSLLVFINQFYVIPDFIVILNLFIILMVNYSYRYLTEEKNKKQIKNIFSHYVSKSVVDELLKNPTAIKLGGEKKYCSVLFSDIESFTTISENLSPEDLVHLINEYHSEMTEMVFENNGFLDKYEGDAIMAVYGAPVSDEEHAFNACKSALEMQRRLKQLQKKWENEKKPVLKCRIGINSGTMIVGNMGSMTRFDYTVMGDEVNLASRLEGANKVYGSKIMIGENTYIKTKDGIVARKLDLLQVKGKNKPVPVYELLALKGQENAQLQKKVQFFEDGFDEYLHKNWAKALQYYEVLTKLDPADLPAKVFAKRCQNYIENPPDKSWNGIFTMKTK